MIYFPQSIPFINLEKNCDRKTMILKTTALKIVPLKKRLRLCLAALPLIVMLVSVPSHALPEDSDQPIHIESDKAERYGTEGKTVYIGSVILTQGSLKLVADKLTILTNDNNEVSELIAVGEPAHLQQRPEVDSPITHARGSTLKYFIDKEVIELISKASLQQDDSTVESDHIEYYMADRTVKAGGTKDGKPARVQVVLPPKSKN